MGSGKRIVVAGAGPCGLMAAYDLARSGYDVTVLEKESLPGGLCKTVSFGPFRFDLGGHRFISSNEELIADIKALLGDELLLRERRSVVVLDEKLYHYPLKIDDVLQKLPAFLALGSLASYLGARIGRRGMSEPRSFKTWAISNFGRVLYKKFFEPYTAKLWGCEPDKLSSDWASQRISGLSLGKALVSLLWISRGQPRTYARNYYYPRRGIGQIFERMVEEIRESGGRVVFACEIMRLATEHGLVKSVVTREGGGEKTYPCDELLSTLPLDEITALATEESPPNGIKFRSLRFLNVVLSQADFSPYTWIYVPDRECIMTRIQEPKRRSPLNAPAGKTSLIFEIPCNYGDETWRESDENLLARCLEDLEKLSLPVKRSVEGCFSTRAKAAYPVLSVQYEEARASCLSRLSRLPNLMTCGRNGSFKYIFMDQAMLMGRKAARLIMSNRRTGPTLERIGEEDFLIESRAVCV